MPLPFIYWQESTSIFLSWGPVSALSVIGGYDILFMRCCSNLFFAVAQQSNLSLDRLIVEVSRSHTIRDTHTHTHTHGITHLNERSARPIGRYQHNTQQTKSSDSKVAQPPGSATSNYYWETKVNDANLSACYLASHNLD